MALRLWVISCVFGTVACSGTSGSSPGGGDGGSSGASSTNGASTTAASGAGGASAASSTGSSNGSSSNGGSSSGGSSNGGSSNGGQGGDSEPDNTHSSSNTNTSFGGTSNHDQPDCDTYFDELDRSCQSVDDCKAVQHQTDCCGSMLVMGIASTAEPDFSAVEQYCAAKFPLCGCAPRGLQLEDGTIIDLGSGDYAAECVEGQCRSHSTAPTSACGPQLRCTAAEYCHELIGGPAGSEPSYSCVPLGDCQDCACLDVVGCQCTESDGAIQVNCAAP